MHRRWRGLQKRPRLWDRLFSERRGLPGIRFTPAAREQQRLPSLQLEELLCANAQRPLGADHVDGALGDLELLVGGNDEDGEEAVGCGDGAGAWLVQAVFLLVEPEAYCLQPLQDGLAVMLSFSPMPAVKVTASTWPPSSKK